MISRFFLLTSLVVLASCYSKEELEQVLPGSWEFEMADSGLTGCHEYYFDGPNGIVESYLYISPGSPMRHFKGLWHPLRGLRVQHHVGLARDSEGSRLPLKEVTNWRRYLFSLSEFANDSFKMHDSDNKEYSNVWRVNSCDDYIERNSAVPTASG